MRRSLEIWLIVCVTLLGPALLFGCENMIEPLSDDAETIFAIHGFLDTSADSQFVRVSALRPVIMSENPSLENVSVSSLDVNSGQATVWTDSLVRLDDGSDGHLYYSLWTPVPGHTYRLEIRKGDGQAATATTEIPLGTEMIASPARGDSFSLIQDVVLLGLSEAPQKLVMKYDVSVGGSSLVEEVKIVYGQSGRVVPGGWETEVYLSRDQQIILQELGLPFEHRLVELKSLGALITLPSEEWQRPDRPDNMDNAHGFFGSIGVFKMKWRLESDAVGTMGFVDGQTGI